MCVLYGIILFYYFLRDICTPFAYIKFDQVIRYIFYVLIISFHEKFSEFFIKQSFFHQLFFCLLDTYIILVIYYIISKIRCCCCSRWGVKRFKMVNFQVMCDIWLRKLIYRKLRLFSEEGGINYSASWGFSRLC